MLTLSTEKGVVLEARSARVSRSAAMAMVGHKTESIYRRYAIVDAVTLREAAAKIDRAAGHATPNAAAQA